MKNKTPRMSINEFKDKPKRNKHKAVKTTYKGRTYDSKKEAEFAQGLDALQKVGSIVSWIPQVRFPLPGKSYHYVDFLVFMTRNEYKLYEVKGRDLPMGKLKRKQVEEIYHVKITVV